MNSSVRNSIPSGDETRTRIEMQQKWIPTERIIKMWLPSVEMDSGLGKDSGPRNSLSVQRMRASVRADSVQVFYRMSRQEYY